MTMTTNADASNKNLQEQQYFIGVDVGTGSARSGLVDSHGKVIATCSREIKMWKPATGLYEQSSDDIWKACCETIKSVMSQQPSIEPHMIKGIGFDATCSLVALDENDKPVSVSPTGNDEQNIIVWLDHRALPQAKRINDGKHRVLDYVGGTISPEMETPKLLWLKENLPLAWSKTHRFFDLPDFLTFKATGNDTRSLCSLVCKWTYVGKEATWDDSYFREIGLGDLVDDGYTKIGTVVKPMGDPIANGLSKQAAAECGLLEGTPVGVSIIDAHAGGIGVLGAVLPGEEKVELERRIAVISGTSACHMAVNAQPVHVAGVWGPYYSAMIPNMWLNEGGESAVGYLIDHVINSHSASRIAAVAAAEKNQSVYEFLNDQVKKIATEQALKHPALLTRNVHVLPYFHGNRSPRADPHASGAMSGLKLTADLLEDLVVKYLATIQSLAHGTKHIIQSLNDKGYNIDTIFITGGNAKNALFVSEHADITGCRMVKSRETDAVILGSAILGSVAGKIYPTVQEAMSNMCAAGIIANPQPDTAKYHKAKHDIFLKMYVHEQEYRTIMSEF